MSISRKLLLASLIIIGCFGGVCPSWAQTADPATLWADFNHYVRIARPDLAGASASSLMDRVQNHELLDIVEASDYEDYEDTIARAVRIESLAATAQALADRIEAARIARVRDPDRIAANIQKLAENVRANLNATNRLRAAGQHAAPQLLGVLLDDRQEQLRPYSLAAMVAIGKPMTYPLSVALPQLEPVQMGQVSRVLAEIGYPEALPYLKQVLEDPKTDDAAAAMAQSAYERLLEEAKLPHGLSTSELFLMLGQKRYAAATAEPILPQVDAATGKGIVWEYSRSGGLSPIKVPGEVFGDVSAMRFAREALRANPEMDAALSLWLMANQRRENRLSDGSSDPSYGADMQAPAFYLDMAGPIRQHDVLARALDDGDTDLALDAIAALTATAGTQALIGEHGAAQPLLRALAYPDRRVRFSAAFALANARPQSEFPGSHRVVPVLAEAIRQSSVRFALALGKTQESINMLSTTLQRMGFQVYGGMSLEDVADEINASPGIDLIVVEQSAEQVELVRRQTAVNYKLVNVPIVAIVSLGVQVELTQRMQAEDRVQSVVTSTSEQNLYAAIEQSIQPYTSSPYTPEEASNFALTAMAFLEELATAPTEIFNASDAQPALIQSLDDKRQPVAIKGADVLARIDHAEAQQAIADAALNVIRPTQTRIAMFNSLARSAAYFGNQLTESQLINLHELVKTSRGDLAVSAAKAHGALTLPTSDVVDLIVK